ncbi:MAG: hypothetical protein AAFY42_01905 [Pseudomonadota bacterium]
MVRSLGLLCLSAALVAGCAPSLREVPPTVSASPSPANADVPAPRILREEGLGSVIGKGASSLTQRFGRARLDLSEGDVRKLQFISQDCVLDVFLYPLERGSRPVATHVEARKRIGGGSADRAECIQDVERSAGSG